MKRSSVLSRVFFRRATVRGLVPDLKLVLLVVTVGCESHVGVYRPAGLSEDTGLEPSSLAGALDDLERRGHIVRDLATGELFVAEFFRDNTFGTVARRGQARADFEQIESAKLRAKVLDAVKQNPGSGLTTSNLTEKQTLIFQGKEKGEVKAAAPPAHTRGTADAITDANAAASHQVAKVRTIRPSGIVTWCDSDPQAAEQIEQQFSADEISAAVATVTATGKDAVPGLVSFAIAKQRNTQASIARRAAADAAYAALLASSSPTNSAIDAAARDIGRQMLPPPQEGDIYTVMINPHQINKRVQGAALLLPIWRMGEPPHARSQTHD